ncbi:MAG: response regulator [Chloroflexi bacterium]|nr:response regulator [Chloroflexota bacterium]
MKKVFNGSAVPRHLVFILKDGSFTVQWDEHRVQELLTGRYRPYQTEDFGHAITDYELNQLKAAGRVEHYNKYFVWLYSLPEQGPAQFEPRPQEARLNRVRTYYLNTTRPKTELRAIEAALSELRLGDDFFARIRGDLVVILGKNGAPFRQLTDTEKAQKHLQSAAPDVFNDLVIAFVETPVEDNDYRWQTEPGADGEVIDPELIHDSQHDLSVTAGKRVVLVVSDDHEREAFCDLLLDMKLDLRVAATGADAIHLIEDFHPHLLLMDLQLPDMHGWRMLNKVKETGRLDDLATIVVAEHTSSADEQTFALTVARIDVFLVKPLSMARLRQNVWTVLKNHPHTTP